MLKYLVLVIILVLQVSLFPQVKIQDEINLNSDEVESSGIITPFYGRVRETLKNGIHPPIACANSRTTLYVDGASYEVGPCWDWTCAGYPSYCTCGYSGDPYFEIPDIPAGRFVDTQIEHCTDVN